MRDVLENLLKLPAKSLAVIDDQVVVIRRGAATTAPAHTRRDEVDTANRRWGVMPQQAQAMIIGVMSGWDADGADPDTHAAPLDQPKGPFDYTISVDFMATFEVRAGSFREAEAKVGYWVKQIDDLANERLNAEFVAFGETGDQWEIIETDDPAA